MNNEPKATTPIEIHLRPNRAERRRRAAIAKKRERETAKLLARIGDPEVEIETDGRFLADYPKVPGAMAYGTTALEAVKKSRAVALEATAPTHVSIAEKRRWAKHRAAQAELDRRCDEADLAFLGHGPEWEP